MVEDDLATAGLGVFVRKGSGFNEASANGRYVRCTLGTTMLGYSNPQWGDVQRLAIEKVTMVFAGTGSYTETGTEQYGDRILSEITLTNGLDTAVYTVGILTNFVNDPINDSGTYTMSDNGLMLLNGMIPVQVSSDGNAMVSAIGLSEDNYATTYTTFAVKQPSAMPTNGIDAAYFILVVGEEFAFGDPIAHINSHRLETERVYVFLHRDNTFSLREDDWTAINRFENVLTDIGENNMGAENRFSTDIIPQTILLGGGTYSIATNGVVSLNFNDGDTGEVQLSENGEYLVFGEIESDHNFLERQVGFGVRRNPPDTFPKATFTDLDMTSTGLVMTATLPAGKSVDGIYTTNLFDGDWAFGGSYTSLTGTVTIHDPGAGDQPKAFYGATFSPW